jgi:hypothetical protein
MWSEYHELLYQRTPVIKPRTTKGLLPWIFRELETLVKGEWDKVSDGREVWERA